jgi:hypothetical protein
MRGPWWWAQLRPALRRGAPLPGGTVARPPSVTSVPTSTPVCRTPSASTMKRRAIMAEEFRDFAERGFLNIAGGCCGTTPEHIRAIAAAVAGVAPRPLPRREPACRLRPRALRDPQRQPVRERRRAHQRHRLGALQEADPRRRLRHGAGRRAHAGRGRRAGHRHQHGRGHARCARGDGHLPQPAAAEPDISACRS